MAKRKKEVEGFPVSSTTIEVAEIVGTLQEKGKSATTNRMKNELNLKTRKRTEEFLAVVIEEGFIEYIKASGGWKLTQLGLSLFKDEFETQVSLTDWTLERYFGRDGLFPKKPVPPELRPHGFKEKNGEFFIESKSGDFKLVVKDDLKTGTFVTRLNMETASSILDDKLLTDFGGDSEEFKVQNNVLVVQEPLENIIIEDVRELL